MDELINELIGIIERNEEDMEFYRGLEQSSVYRLDLKEEFYRRYNETNVLKKVLQRLRKELKEC